MPELPEVEAVKRGLSATVVGRRVDGVKVLAPRSFEAPAGAIERLVAGHTLQRVERRGKLLVIGLDSGAHLLVHLMMTGQLVVVEAQRTLFAGGHPSLSMLGPMPNGTTRVTLRLDGDRKLYFNDGRKFGRIRLVDSATLAADPFLCRLGPEPLGESFTLDAFRTQLARHARAPIKAVLLDQTVVAGIGNIYADESLHLARVHPARPAGSLSAEESRRLRGAVRRVLSGAIANGGTSLRHRAGRARGEAGHLPRARVFRREGQPCRVCGTEIERTRVAGRTTRVCPRCQPPPPARRAGRRRAATRERPARGR